MLLLAAILLFHGELFRPYELSEVCVTDNYIYAAPFELSEVFLFDLDGTFIRTIGRKGQGPGEFEFVHLSGVFQENLWAVSGRNPSHLYEFEASGKLVSETPIATLGLKGWPYRIKPGWLMLKEKGGHLGFIVTQEDFSNPRPLLKIAKPNAKNLDHIESKRLMWGITRNRKTFFYLHQHSKTLLAINLTSGTKATIDLGEIKAIPDPQGEKDLLGHRKKLPLFSGLQIGLEDLCLIYTGAHRLHSNLAPLVFNPDGKMEKYHFSSETWRRLVEVRGNHAWVLTFDDQEGAGIKRLEIAKLDAFTAANRIEFTEIDLMTYWKSRIQKGTP